MLRIWVSLRIPKTRRLILVLYHWPSTPAWYTIIFNKIKRFMYTMINLIYSLLSFYQMLKKKFAYGGWNYLNFCIGNNKK